MRKRRMMRGRRKKTRGWKSKSSRCFFRPANRKQPSEDKNPFLDRVETSERNVIEEAFVVFSSLPLRGRRHGESSRGAHLQTRRLAHQGRAQTAKRKRKKQGKIARREVENGRSTDPAEG